MQIIQELPEELAAILFAAGSRRLVLLEGDDDAAILGFWYHDKKSSLYLYPAGGSVNIIRLLDAFDNHGRINHLYAIRDRDFRSLDEVQADEKRFQGHLFTLPRYAIENYILEPEAVWRELSFLVPSLPIQDITAMEDKMLEIFEKLCVMMASNWVFSEQSKENKVKFFSPAHDECDEETLINMAQQRLGFSLIETKQLIDEKVSIIASSLRSFESAQAYINGKHIFHHLHKLVVSEKPGLSKGYLLLLLARAVQTTTGIPNDIKQIVESNILGIF